MVQWPAQRASFARPYTDVQFTLGTALDGKEISRPVVLRGREATAHKLVLGLTGSGKSYLLDTLCLQGINQNVGCVYLDPHGDECRNVLRTLKATGFFNDKRAYKRVVYLRFRAHGDRYVPMNILNQPYDAHHVARLVLEAWTRAWPALAGGAAPVVEQLVLASSYTLIRNALPLTAMERLLTDTAFRHRLLAHVDDTEVIACFERFEAAGRRGGLLSDSTLRRSFLMLFSPVLRYSLGCMENVLQFSQRMADNVTVLCDFGSLDEDTRSGGAYDHTQR